MNDHTLQPAERTEAALPTPQSTSRATSPSEAQQPEHPEPDRAPVLHRLRIYSHSSLFYWWPVWVVGYVMALITYAEGQGYQLGRSQTWVHPSSNPGLLFFLVLFLVLVITNFSVRGLASGMVIMGAVLLAVVLAFVGWWDEVFTWFGHLRIHLTLGA